MQDKDSCLHGRGAIKKANDREVQEKTSPSEPSIGVLTPTPTATPVPSLRSQQLFAILANPAKVNLSAEPHHIPERAYPQRDGRVESAEAKGEAGVAAKEETEVDAGVQALLTHSRCLSEASRSILRFLSDEVELFDPADVEAARLKLGWPHRPISEVLSDGRSESPSLARGEPHIVDSGDEKTTATLPPTPKTRGGRVVAATAETKPRATERKIRRWTPSCGTCPRVPTQRADP